MSLGKFDGIADTALGGSEGVAVANIKSIMGSDLDSGPAVPFETEWTVTAGQSVTLPLIQNRAEGALSYNCSVDWGDSTPASTVTSYNDANRIHTYTSGGTYRIKITGTMEGWSFNNTGDKLKIVKIIDWGNSAGFNGFKYLKRGFHGCTNLTSIPAAGSIIPSGFGVGTDGFNGVFLNTRFTTIPVDTFKLHTAVTTFESCFNQCASLTTIPADLFRYNTAITKFDAVFANCTSLVTIPAHLFDYNIAVTSFFNLFNNSNKITAIPSNLFDYNTLAIDFTQSFLFGSGLTSIPTDLFKYNVNATLFVGTFQGCTKITSIPTDLFRYNTAITTMQDAFNGCTTLATVPTDLFRYNTACLSFVQVFDGCIKLQLNAWIFYATGEETTRFLNKSVVFTSCFRRVSFTGTQGTAPELWNCTWGSGTPTTTTCYNGAGNSLTSLTNYASIPGAWI